MSYNSREGSGFSVFVTPSFPCGGISRERVGSVLAIVHEARHDTRRGGGGIQFVHGPSRMTLASLLCRDGARRVFTNQADIACTKREGAVRCSASRVKGELHPSKNRS